MTRPPLLLRILAAIAAWVLEPVDAKLCARNQQAAGWVEE